MEAKADRLVQRSLTLLTLTLSWPALNCAMCASRAEGSTIYS